VDGNVYVYQYHPTENKLALHLRPFKKACRALQFSTDGSKIFCGSTDCSIKEIDLNQSKVSWGQGNAHDCGINTMKLKGDILASGDEEGTVKVWDTKNNKLIFAWTENEDFISDIDFHENLMFCSSGDGTLSVFDIKAGKFVAASHSLNDELLSVAVIKNGQKVICGTQVGKLKIFSQNKWGLPSDNFAGHPESIDSIVVLNEDMIFTGSSDGLIRVVQIHPNQFLGVIGEHENYPIERMSLSHDKELLVSCSHDNSVKFWNISCFWGEDGDEENEEKLKQDLEQTKLPKRKRDLKKFFSDL
jgi:WD40 repeat protein